MTTTDHTLACLQMLALDSSLTPFCHFHYVTNVVLAEGAQLKCSLLHSQFLDHFKCTNSTLHFHTLSIYTKVIDYGFGYDGRA